MKSKWKFAISVLLFINVLSWINFFHEVKAEIQKAEKTDLYAVVQEIEAAMSEIDPEMKKQLITTDTPVTLADEQGNTIIYHCLTTTYYADDPVSFTGINMEAVSLIIDSMDSDHSRNCMVNEQPAVLYQKGSRSYLCWTLSPQYSFVIEYSHDLVPEREIIRMAEELRLP